MSEKDLEQQKKEAAAKAKEEALKRLAERKAQMEQKAQGAEDIQNEDMKALKEASSEEDEKAKAKAKAAAAAKAKAAALAKQKAQAEAGAAPSEDEKAKAKAVAAAKAKAAALAKKKTGDVDETDITEKKPLPNQELLDQYVKRIGEMLGGDVLEEAYINPISKFVPTIVVKKEYYYKIAECLKLNEQLYFDYVVELHGTDFVTHMEVFVQLYSHIKNQNIVLKVKLDRDQPIVPSLVPLWEGANWPECEAYDLLGIQFENHPDLKRILLGEEWVGYPLRKDYEPYDVEV